MEVNKNLNKSLKFFNIRHLSEHTSGLLWIFPKLVKFLTLVKEICYFQCNEKEKKNKLKRGMNDCKKSNNFKKCKYLNNFLW